MPHRFSPRTRLMAVARFYGLLVAMIVAACSLDAHAQLFEDPPAILNADDTMSEEENDHVEAVALFAHGRVLLQRGLVLDGDKRRAEFATALRRFQRAWWFDNNLVSILEDIAPLTFELDRQFEATRYLIIAAEQQDVPAELVERVAAELADLESFDTEQSERALKLYRKLKEKQGDLVSALTQFQIGRIALTTGKFEEAAAAFSEVQEALAQQDEALMPKRMRERLLRRPEATYALFGESYLRAKRLDDAQRAFELADKAKPDAASLALRLALIENERGNREKSVKRLQMYFDEKSTSAGITPYVLLAELIDGPPEKKDPNSDTEEKTPPRKPSEELVNKLLSISEADPANALLGYYLADALRRAQRWEEAEKLYKRLLEQDPAADGHQGLVDIYNQQKKYDALLEQLAAVVARTGSLDLLDDAEELHEALEELAKHADVVAQDEQQTAPDGAWLALALLHAGAKEPEMALEFFEKGLKSPIPTVGQAAVNLAFAMFQSDEPERAAEVFQKILDNKLLPDRSAEVYFYLAGAWTLAKDYDKGLAAAQESARRDPNSARMAAREPWVLYQAKQLDKARDRYVELLDKFDPDHSSLENREVMRDVRLALSAVEVELKNHSAAEEWLQQTLDEFPEDIGAYNDLGYLWTDQGKHLNRSLKMVQKAVDAEPDNIAYLDSLGWAYYQLERYQEALEPLEKAAKDDGVDGVILDHLGDVYLKTDQVEEAVRSWQRAKAALEKQNDKKRLKTIEEKIKRYSK